MSESSIQSQIKLGAGSMPNVRVFRNQVGVGWVGNIPGKLIKPLGLRRVTMGLFPGSADLIGWTSHTIAPSDVGKTFAIFTSVEVKDGHTAPKPNQENWMNEVNAAGGIAFVTNSKEHAVSTLSQYSK